MEEQGYHIEKNILYQDNKSAILLETNGRKSAGKRSRALNIRYFFLTDQVKRGNLSIEYCPTEEMLGNFHSKPLQGEKFRRFSTKIMGSQARNMIQKLKNEKKVWTGCTVWSSDLAVLWVSGWLICDEV